MLTTPIFRAWRPVWDSLFKDATQRLDKLVKKRQEGCHIPPLVDDPSCMSRIVVAMNLGEGRVDSSEFFKEKIETLLRACLWPRWLLLEEALEQVANSGDLHMSAIILRSQIEELDVMRVAATVLLKSNQGTWDEEGMTGAMQTLIKRVFPRIQKKNSAQLCAQASDAELASSRPESLRSSLAPGGLIFAQPRLSGVWTSHLITFF